MLNNIYFDSSLQLRTIVRLNQFTLAISFFVFQIFMSNVFAESREIKYETGDLMLMNSVKGSHEIYHLWPDNGKRDDDPLNELNEIYDRRIKNVSRPSLMVMKPEVSKGIGILVFPGGGYKHLAAKKEGSQIGEWLNKQGITAFIIKYRVPKRENIDASLQDAQRAMRFVRKNAKKFEVHTSKIGVMGFSAGAHLCLRLIQRRQAASYEAIDSFDEENFNPNFCALVYPAYLDTLTSKSTSIIKFNGDTIPIYITIAKNDSFLAGVNNFVSILKQSNINHDYYPYPDGGHGSGLMGFPWTKSFKKWLTRL